MEKANLKLYVITFFLIFSAFLWQCTHPGTGESHSYNASLSLADSIANSNPNSADSIYRIVIHDSLDAKTEDYTQALIGLSMLYVDKGYYDSSTVFLNIAECNIYNIEDTIILMKFHLAKGYQSSMLLDYETTKLHYIEGLKLAKQSKNANSQHAFRLNLGRVYLETGDFTKAAEILTEELKFADSIGNSFNQSVALEGLASLAYQTNNYNLAISYSKQSLALLKKLEISNEYALQLMNLGIYYKAADMTDSAMAAYKEALVIMAEAGDSLAMVRVRFNMANILKNQKKYDEAENELNQVLRFCESQNIVEGQVYARTTLSTIYKETGRLNQSIEAVDSALSLAESYNMLTILPRIYNSRHEILAEFGRYKDAYLSSLQSQSISDSLLNVEKQKEILDLNKRYENQKKESENQMLKKDVEIQNSNFKLLILYSVLGLSLLLLSISLLIIKYKRFKQQKLIAEEKAIFAEKENKSMETELKNAMMEKQLIEQELVFKSLISAEMIQINRSVKEKLAPFESAIQRKKDKEDFVLALSNLTRDAAKDPIAEFEPVFKQIHPAFYEKLLLLAPELSKSELQLAALLRLNLSSKDIAHLINLSINTIEIKRHNIRKKLKLEQSVSLTTYLISI